jgi:ribulose-phosphate 3-epimerase
MKISTSILNADLSNLQSQVAQVRESGAEMLHIDVMDGRFVPPLTIGDVVVKSLLPHKGGLVFDTHLMVSEPSATMLQNFAAAGSDYITIHVESGCDVCASLEYIKKLGCKAGLAINPPTPIERLYDYLELADMFLIMSVNPGYGGQAFIPETLGKIAALRAELHSRGISAEIEVDGGINDKTAPDTIKAGADILVSGSYLFNAPNMAEAVRSIAQPHCQRQGG